MSGDDTDLMNPFELEGSDETDGGSYAVRTVLNPRSHELAPLTPRDRGFCYEPTPDFFDLITYWGG